MRLKSKVCLAAAVAALSAVTGFGVTWAYYYGNHTLVNPLSTAHSGVTMHEEFNPQSYFIPGEEIPKVVTFENTGDMDLFLRVEVPPDDYWLNADVTPAKELEASKVIKGWSDEWTDVEQPINGVYEKLQVNKGTEGITPEAWGETAYWSKAYQDKGGTYYRYYKKVLKPGDVTDAVLEFIKLDPMASSDRHTADYSDKIYKLNIEAQAVPVEWAENTLNDSQLAAQSEWGMNVTSSTTDSSGSTWVTWDAAK